MSRLVLAACLLVLLALGANAVYRARPPGHPKKARTDLTVYLAGGREALAGRDPLGATNRHGWPYVYPPTLAVGLIPLTPLPLRVASGLWYLLSAAALVGGVLAVRRALRSGEEAADPEWKALEDGVPLALVLLPAASALLRGQVGPLLLGLLGAAWLCLVRRRDATAGLLIALATAIKLTPGLVLVGLLAARRWRAFIAGCLGLVLWLVVVPAPFLGPRGTVEALGRFGQKMVVRPITNPGDPDLTTRNIHIGTNQSLASQVIRRTAGPARLALLALLAVAAIGAALFLTARGEQRPKPEAYALLLAAPLLVAPIAWHHHHVLLLPALALLAVRRDRLARGALVVFGVLSLTHFAIGPLRGLGLLGLGTLAVFGVVASPPARS